jgi:hypothetical protein
VFYHFLLPEEEAGAFENNVNVREPCLQPIWEDLK